MSTNAAPRTVHVVPHTHWDREWYEPFQRFRMRLVDLVDHVLAEADADERFCFTFDGQLAAVDDYLDVRPGEQDRVRRLVGTGQLAIGPWRILSDEFLVSGETLVRNLEQGWARAAELGGAMRVGYLPDEFGHVAQMPQILRRAGIDDACLWRGVPGAVGHHVFDWVAPDGSSVRCEYLPLGYGNAAWLFDDPDRLGDAVPRLVDWMAPYFGDDDVLAMYGTDHTWPISRLAEVASRDGDGRSGPVLHVTTLPRYLTETRRTGERRDRWVGELRAYARANLLPGVTSSRVGLKRMQARAERLLERYAEPFSALWLPVTRWPQPFLDIAWTKVVECSGHDSVTGCGHDEVAQQVELRLVEARQIATALRDRAAAAAAARCPGTDVALNPSPFARTEVVERPDGSVALAAVPPLGWAAVTAVETPYPPVEVEVEADGAALGNGLLHVWVEADGTLTVTREGVTLHGVGRLVDGGDAGDLYNYAPPAIDTLVDAPEAVTVRLLAADPLRSTVCVERRYRWPRAAAADWTRRLYDPIAGPVSVVTTVVEVRAGEPFVRLTVSFDNACRDHRLRLHLGTGAEPADSSYAEGQFAVVRRGLTAEGGHGEEPLATFPARGFVVAGSAAVLLEQVTEYEVVAGGNELAVTLLRAVRQISRPDHPLRAENAGPALPTPGGQCLGEVEASLAVMPVAGEWWQAGVAEAAERFAQPLVLVPGDGSTPGEPAAEPGLALDGAVLSALRRRGEELEVRFVRLRPDADEVTLTYPGASRARPVDMLGRPLGPDEPIDGGVFRTRLGGWEIATVRLG